MKDQVRLRGGGILLRTQMEENNCGAEAGGAPNATERGDVGRKERKSGSCLGTNRICDWRTYVGGAYFNKREFLRVSKRRTDGKRWI